MLYLKNTAKIALAGAMAHYTMKSSQNLFLDSSNEEESSEKTAFHWGNGTYQARPDNRRRFSNFTPKELKAYRTDKGEVNKNPPIFKQIKANDDFIIGMSDEGKVYCSNNNGIPAFLDKTDKDRVVEHKEGDINLDNMLDRLRDLSFPGESIKLGMTKGFLWTLDKSGKLYQMPLNQLKKEESDYKWRQIQSIDNLKDIETGEDHILMLKENGILYSMGDDTNGQCGQGAKGRLKGGPFTPHRIRNPGRVASLEDIKVEKIYAGGNHSMIITDTKDVLGFGNNSHMQLAHRDEYITNKDPAFVFFEPTSFSGYLSSVHCNLQDLALGNDFSIFVCKNRKTKSTQIYGCGHNMNGQLGNGFLSHTNDFQLMDTLSDFVVPTKDGKEEDVSIKSIKCGRTHCMALLSLGIAMVWGGNEFGQLGNKKRSFKETPLIVSKFKGKQIDRILVDENMSYLVINDDKQDK